MCHTRSPLDSYPEEQKMMTARTDIDPDPNTDEAGSNIKARKVSKILIIIQISKITTTAEQFTVQTIHSQDHTPGLRRICAV